MRSDLRQELCPHLVSFQQMPKYTDRRLVRDRLTDQINGARVVQHLLDRRVRHIEPLLQTMEAQHALDAHRRTLLALAFE